MDYSNNFIMLIEDDSLFRKYLSKNIGIYIKCYTVEANDAEEADEYLDKNIPDLIILDINLPGTNGVDYLKKIRSDPKTKDIHVIPCTSEASKLTILSMIKLGIDDFIEKKAKTDVIIEKIKKSLDKFNFNKEKINYNKDRKDA